MNRLTWIAPLVFIAVMLGGVGVAQATGAWITSGKQVVAVGQLAPEGVKGSMTLRQAADGLGMPFAELVTLVNPPDPSLLTPATAFKELEALVPGFDLATFRETLRTYHTATAQATGTGTADASHLTVAALVAECGLPSDVNADLTLRELADSVPGFDVQVVKDAVARLR